ncbi:SDR family oxidoreductase [Paenibacillaceae bacterium WGS1546]|uniref:SDR family oxidoreductase n=1 Tax=Cohnella sp. WGS1546 TaxID=3366810 RepID=UPI00372D7041
MRILITGASRGLGLELVELAAAGGNEAIACARDLSSLPERMTARAADRPGRIRWERLDVTLEEEAAALAKRLREESLELDAIVNNAGVLLAREHRIGTLPLDEVRRTFEVNLFGPMAVMKHFAPLLAEGATVVNVSSEAGSFAGAYGGDYPYALSKAALNYFSKQLGEELRGRGVRVLAVHPGWIRTDMGGTHAPLEAADSARGVWSLLERRTNVPEDVVFVNHLGEPMPL